MRIHYPYRCSKTYGQDVGLSCCFRQWRATHSHCQYLHGYALGVHLEFEALTLDARNWVVDFGALKPVKDWLQLNFDHTTVVARDDPKIRDFMQLEKDGLIQLQVMANVGCEAFAEAIFYHVQHDFLPEYLNRLGVRKELHANDPVRLHHVRVFEHGANGASYYLEHS